MNAPLAGLRIVEVSATGNFDGSGAMDYTVNCSSGFPIATGPSKEKSRSTMYSRRGMSLPACIWPQGCSRPSAPADSRAKGRRWCSRFSDVMLATVASLGYVAAVQVNGTSREPTGNDLCGAFGRNFKTADAREIMIVAISDRQWRAIGKATGLAEKLAMIGPLMDVDLATEGGLFSARHALAAVLEPWFAHHTLAQIGERFEGSGVLWGVYRDFKQLVEEDARCSIANPMFGRIEQPGIGPVLAPRGPLSFSANDMPPPMPAPVLGGDTAAVLEELVGLTRREIGRLHDRKLM